MRQEKASDGGAARGEHGLPARFQVVRLLGEGSFGEVFHVFDEALGIPVALKRLKANRPDLQLLFRNEFRTMQRISHPHLVKLYEYDGTGDVAFYTMELVEGVPFHAYTQCRSQGQGAHVPDISDHRLSALVVEESVNDFVVRRTLDLDDEDDESVAASTGPSGGPGSSDSSSSFSSIAALPVGEGQPRPFDEARLRLVLPQLVAGVMALHQADTWHRDLKPSNVLVTEDGVLKILDFGLVHRVDDVVPGLVLSGVGTPAYMPPLGEAPGEAGDWYSVGVMLYVALAGRLPFDGNRVDILQKKRDQVPLPPSAWVEGVPGDLEALCMGLLEVDASARLHGEALSQALGLGVALPRQAHFVGREEELARLESAFLAVKQGGSRVVLMPGPAGSGKSALVARFLRKIRTLERDDCVLFSVQCFAQESVPYRTISGFIDALSLFLNRLSRTARSGLLPYLTRELLQLFPVLAQVKDLAPVAPLPQLHAQELQRRAFAALRDLIVHIASQYRLILCLDDLQWMDDESARLLEALGQPPMPPLLALLSYRREDGVDNAFLQQLLVHLSTSEEETPTLVVEDLPMRPLDEASAEALLVALLNKEEIPDATKLQALLEDAQGSPLLLKTFAQHIAAQAPAQIDAEGAHAQPTLEAAIHAIFSQCSASSQTLLELLAVGREPLSLSLIRQLMSGDRAWVEELPILRHLGFLRVQSDGNEQSFGLYHSQLRGFLRNAMSAERRETLHLRLAGALVVRGEGEPARKAYHYHKAGKPKKALGFLLDAAAQAQEALSFAHAAALYDLALAWGEGPGDVALWTSLAEAHANSGHGVEAAAAYLKAGALAPGYSALGLRQRAAEQLLCSGDVKQALALFAEIFQTLGLDFPTTARAAEGKILWHRLLLWGWRANPTPPNRAPDLHRQAQAEACFALSLIFGHIDPVRALYFQVLFLRLARNDGDVGHYALALIVEGLYRCVQDETNGAKHRDLIEQGMHLAKQYARPRILVTAQATLGFVDFFQGRWHRGYRRFEACESYVRAHGIHVWEKSSAHVYKMNTLLFMGDFSQIAEQLSARLEDARQRGDRLTRTFLLWGVKVKLDLAQDRPDVAYQTMAEAAAGWTNEGFDLQRYIEMLNRAEIALYLDDPALALQELDACQASIAGLRLHHSQFHQIELHNIYSRAWLGLLGRAETVAERASLQEKVWRACDKIDTLFSWGVGFSRLLRAGLASWQDDHSATTRALIAAETTFAQLDMQLHALVARYAWGLCEPGARGERLCQEARVEASRLGIAQLEKTVRMLAPGRWGTKLETTTVL